jgi:hypothetical protein
MKKSGKECNTVVEFMTNLVQKHIGELDFSIRRLLKRQAVQFVVEAVGGADPLTAVHARSSTLPPKLLFATSCMQAAANLIGTIAKINF